MNNNGQSDSFEHHPKAEVEREILDHPNKFAVGTPIPVPSPGGAILVGIGVEPQPSALPTDSKGRKDIPLARGLLDYFPAALAEIAKVSKAGNDKHNPGEPMHHARGKSSDHADCILRHLIDRGTNDPEDGLRHSAKLAWRALALLQEECEADGAPMARGAWL